MYQISDKRCIVLIDFDYFILGIGIKICPPFFLACFHFGLIRIFTQRDLFQHKKALF